MLKEHRTEGKEGTGEEDGPLPHLVLTGTVLKCVVIPENCHAGVGQSRKSKLKSVNNVESVWNTLVVHVLSNASMSFLVLTPFLGVLVETRVLQVPSELQYRVSTAPSGCPTWHYTTSLTLSRVFLSRAPTPVLHCTA